MVGYQTVYLGKILLSPLSKNKKISPLSKLLQFHICKLFQIHF